MRQARGWLTVAFGRSIWALFRGLPMWAQLPVGVVGSLFALGVVTAPFADQAASPAPVQIPVTEPSTSTTLVTTTSSSTTPSTSTTSTSTTTSTTVTTVATTTTAAPATAATTPTTAPRVTVTTATTAAVVRTTVAAQPVSCPNGTYTNTAGNEVCRPYEAPTAPAGASALCKDGSYSFSQTRSGTCSGHGGVSQWL